MTPQAKTTRRVTLHYDLISPFAHIALRRLSELPDGVEVEPSPVLLGALLRHWGQLGPGEIAPKRRFTYRLSTHLATRHGIPIHYPPRHPFNPLAALRILAGADADLAMVGRAFDFVFGQGRPVDTEEGVADFARAIGAQVELAQDERAKARLRALTDEAAARGVFGVPTFDVETTAGRELFWGVDSIDMLNDWLADPALFEREPYAHLEGVEIGVVRK